MKKIALIILGIVILSGAVLYFVFRNKGSEPELWEVKKGSVAREISETGTVKVSEKINVGFKNSGRVKTIDVKVGDSVRKGQRISSLDSDQIAIELNEARAALEIAKADYLKLLAGSSGEERNLALVAVSNAEKSFANAKQSLADIESSAKEDTENAYENAIDDLEDAELKTYNALVVAKEVKLNYFFYDDQESLVVLENFASIQKLYNSLSASVSISETGSFNDVEKSLLDARTFLFDISGNLDSIRAMSETVKYRNVVSSAYKTSLDNHKAYLNTARNNIISAQQDISAVKVSNTKSINTAKSAVDSAEATLNTAKYQLLLTEANPTEESKSLYIAKISQAEARTLLLQNKLGDGELRSPADGKVVEVNKRIGEIAQPTDYIVSIMPSGPFQVEVDIYEEDIVEVEEGNPAVINIPAFPGKDFLGRVVSIDPAEKLIDGVVYYRIKIDLDQPEENMKPGMTADVIIQTLKKENVLVVPRSALKIEGGITKVRVNVNGRIEERQIKTGLFGEDYVEVISGISEGEKVEI
ncbi:MAG: hypothetical protein A2365_02895 [Candidatus Nealsonbacteria bacterium RIFOXYB1_FULL_40_15]|uniref:Membrane fusion protein biotin-lipoyl like domain-containing protein n=2 Tax=Candidatus Nealsoniibacteriota TaxID=1817911 RepID=A0A1G2ERM0_9BACT|nr:MAG: hypothetical protein A2365_02895 [Candidatus Nealsonbacteria bacterium RIFOXYB1_FULL_40_15]OGZ28445.1 MAG: hypothetical protein A2427_02520 [Candidatus Nealsonbacteria bacterium RIFOXYC1_FULL_40_7]OGZ29856.1 MAG: hypothetical protein A2562_01930 [Candidatus Nealsonbacteria bacterium RIFOXYD1_FULL_39_11]